MLVNGSLVVDLKAHQVTVTASREADRHQYGIVEFLMRNVGILHRPDLRRSGTNPLWRAKTVTVHIRRIREKIEIDPKEPRYIKVVWGVGYKIEKQ